MSTTQAVARPLARGLLSRPTPPSIRRPFSLTATRPDVVTETLTAQAVPDPNRNPETVLGFKAERELAKSGTPPVGSRRRRAALRAGANIPFEQLPYQCFQEALAVIRADRDEKVAAIKAELFKIARLEAIEGEEGAERRALRIASLKKHVESLKILADINDPLVKRRFEDGLGDMNKPIYRYLANKKWRSYDYNVIAQRIQQFNIVPDLLPKFAPTADVQLFFRRAKIHPGATVPAVVSEAPPRLRVQVFDKGERLVSVVVVDSDVPDLENDSFTKRCHFMAVNVPLDPTVQSIAFSKLGADRTAPYHRLSVFVLEQEGPVDVEKVRGTYKSGHDSLGFSLKSFRDKFKLKPVGFNLFRTEWDESTAAVMERHNIPGAELEFRRTRVYSLKPERKPRGWEAKRQGPKFKHLWKYTKRIRGLSNAKGWTKRGN
ncbi:related to ribosomal protein YmL35 of the large subunit, mitochondrial [Cephalotrichum gorgonifer]|uniref:Related to ribosomal protein YmL35 of the large subunit, mitochondrial n=1 Tax=Cephalotrichum gorgonifer TaxID=2041049 RepID=A0AAE8N638_9PEZI|nr:related to ribosomal protein YmL35 of the large subunit, mitochondrial [Cephalotrichum gorgonifer]